MQLLVVALATVLFSVANSYPQDAEGLGVREIGDYQLDSLILPVFSQGLGDVFKYPKLGQTITVPNLPEQYYRPEIITRVAMKDDSSYYPGPWSLSSGGPGFTYYITRTYTPDQYTLVTYGKAPPSSLSQGSLSLTDSLLHVEVLTKAAIPNKIVAINLKYPLVGLSTSAITWISVQDTKNNDPAASKIIKGGVGFQHVTIQVRSRVGESLSFFVQIYGKSCTTSTWPWYLSVGAQSDSILFEYWPWSLDEVPMKNKTTCGCHTGKLFK